MVLILSVLDKNPEKDCDDFAIREHSAPFDYEMLIVWSKSAHRDIDLMCKRINIRWVKKSRKQLEVINMFFKHCHIMQGNINVVLLDRDLVEGIRRFTPYTFWTTPYTPVSISYILWWIPSDNSVSSVFFFFSTTSLLLESVISILQWRKTEAMKKYTCCTVMFK